MVKKISFFITLLIASMSFFAQSNHPTINKLEVSYRPVAQSTMNLANIQCVPNATITLKNNSGATKVYFKIINLQTNATLFDVNYSLSSSPVVSNGITLFENSNGVIKISSGQALTLKPYKYELKTEDAQNNVSVVYSSTK